MNLLTWNQPTYQNTVACPSILNAINKNRQKFETYVDIVQECFANFKPAIKSKFICQIEHDETEDKILNDKNENTNKNTKLSLQMDTHQYLLMH